jgi:hypothetical protein
LFDVEFTVTEHSKLRLTNLAALAPGEYTIFFDLVCFLRIGDEWALTLPIPSGSLLCYHEAPMYSYWLPIERFDFSVLNIEFESFSLTVC